MVIDESLVRYGRQADISAAEIAELELINHGYCINDWRDEVSQEFGPFLPCEGDCGSEAVWRLRRDISKGITIVGQPIEITELETFTVDLAPWPPSYSNSWKSYVVVEKWLAKKEPHCRWAGRMRKAIEDLKNRRKRLVR